MKFFIFIYFSTVALACSKNEKCVSMPLLVNTTHHFEEQCHILETGILIRSESELKTYKDSLSCDVFDYSPLSFQNSWIIGYSSLIDYYKFNLKAEYYIDTCLKQARYNYILTQDSSSGRFDNSNPFAKARTVSYCVIKAIPYDYKITYTKTMRYEILP